MEDKKETLIQRMIRDKLIKYDIIRVRDSYIILFIIKLIYNNLLIINYFLTELL